MGDPAGYLDEGKGLPWITMDIVGELVSFCIGIDINEVYISHL